MLRNNLIYATKLFVLINAGNEKNVDRELFNSIFFYLNSFRECFLIRIVIFVGKLCNTLL